MICSICNGKKHTFDKGAWIRCSCIYKELLSQICETLVSQEQLKELLKGIYPALPRRITVRLEKCQERFSRNQNPSNPIIVFGSEGFSKKVEAAFWQIILSNGIEPHNSVHMFDLVDAYFNDSKRFRSFLSNRILMIYFGSEVRNQGAVLAFNAILSMKQVYPIFFSTCPNRSTFLASYPDEMSGIFEQFHIVELK